MFLNKIQSAVGDSKSSEVTTLILNDCEATSFDGLSDEYESLKHLNLANNSFKTLKGFPHLKSLDILDLSNNSIEGGLSALAGCTQLRSLDLSGNQISDIAHLEPLKNCSSLEELKLADCPLTESTTYITEVFNLLPQLKSIDGHGRADAPATNGNSNGSHAQLNGRGDDEEDEEGDEDEEDESGLEQLQKDDLEDDDEEYAPEGEDDEEDDEDDDEDLEEEDDEDGEGEGDESNDFPQVRGVKRKHDDEEVDPEDNSNSAQ